MVEFWALMVEFWVGTFVISTNIPNFLENSSSQTLLTCERSFLGHFWSYLCFWWVATYCHLVPSNPLLTATGIQIPTRIQQKLFFLMVAILLVRNPTKRDYNDLVFSRPKSMDFFNTYRSDILWISNYVPSLSWHHRDIVLVKQHSHTTDTQYTCP
jgi:hypothetical protein